MARLHELYFLRSTRSADSSTASRTASSGASFTSQCALSDAGLDLMSMLTLNPAHRISAKEALSHAYFAEGRRRPHP